jgi:hypothetical protein
MTIMNEAVRLFFAVSALILVGMLAGSGEPAMIPPLSAQWSQSQPSQMKVTKLVSKVASVDKRMEKSERKISRKTAAIKKS